MYVEILGFSLPEPWAHETRLFYCKNLHVCIFVFQVFSYTANKEIRTDDLCLDVSKLNGPVTMLKCHHLKGNQLWEYDPVVSDPVRYWNKRYCFISKNEFLWSLHMDQIVLTLQNLTDGKNNIIKHVLISPVIKLVLPLVPGSLLLLHSRSSLCGSSSPTVQCGSNGAEIKVFKLLN